MKKKFDLCGYLNEHSKVGAGLDHQEIHSALDLIYSTYIKGAKILTCGNGGSAAAASHYITDWTKMVNLNTGKKFRGFSLVDNVGLITAYANDLSYSDVFSGQIKSVMDEGDLLISISGSGNSLNVINAIKAAKEMKGMTLSIVGYDGGIMKDISDSVVHIKSFDMQICEDYHLMFGHWVMKALCDFDVKMS